MNGRVGRFELCGLHRDLERVVATGRSSFSFAGRDPAERNWLPRAPVDDVLPVRCTGPAGAGFVTDN